MKLYTQSSTFRKVATIFLLLSSVHVVPAQELEYKMELGGMIGSSFYLGDANYSTLFKNTSMAGGILARYNFNPRMAAKGNFALGKIHGTTKGLNNKFPQGMHATFSRNIYELGGQFEYNFFAYGTGAGYKDSHRLTPYILAGLGLTYAPSPAKHVFTINIPVGIGLKYKLVERINVGIEWSMRFTASDKLDVTDTEGLSLNNPYQIVGKRLKNKDSYSLLLAYISYDLFPKYRKCNN